MKTRNIGDIVVPKRHPELKSEIIAIGKDFALNPLYVLANGGTYIEDDLKPQAEDYLESQNFYDLMQCYRIAPITDQANVIERFEDVKTFIREKSAAKELLEACKAMINTRERWFPEYNALQEDDCGELENTLFAMVHKLESAIKKAEG